MWEDFDYGGDMGDWGDIGSNFTDWGSFGGWDQPIDFGAFSQPTGMDMPFNPGLMQGMGGGMPQLPVGGWGGGMDVPGAPGGPPQMPQMAPPTYGGGSAMPMSAPGAAAPGGGFLQQMMQPQNLLGLGGGLAGILGQLAGGGKGASASPQMMPQARAAGTQTDAALYNLNPLAMGTNPLQMQQNALLGSLASGQGLPPGYAQLVEQAFQPQMGNIATQAIESARRRGFAGGAELLQQGPAGAIAGPALANLQGQMAQAKLGLMQSLPGLYNTPIANQANAASNVASGYNNLMRSYPTGQQQQGAPLGAQIGTAIGAGLQGLGQSMGQQQQQQQMDQLFRTMQGGALGGQQKPQPGGMSYDWMTGS